jgi:lipopolysaccharide export system protein LptA
MKVRLLLLALLLPIAPTAAQSQEGLCDFRSFGRTSGVEENGVPIVIFHDPFTVVCQDGAELRANSGRLNRQINEVHLVGNVLFQDPNRTLTSQEATYNSRTARLWATGNVIFTDRVEGTSIRGPELEYFRATEERPLAQMTATMRPTVTVPARPGADPAEPLEIVANRVFLLGANDLTAYEDVIITRPDLRGTGGEARYDSAAESLELRQGARIVSDDYELAGEVIQARLADGALEHVYARTDASLRGEDLLVTAPELQLFFVDDALGRAVARAVDGEQTEAISETFRIRADSLDANLVDRQLDQVFAVGRAFAEMLDSSPLPVSEGPAIATSASESPQLLASDWIRGDTIIAYFEPVGAPAEDLAEATDSAPDPLVQGENERSVELRRLFASGSAHSLYRVAADGAPPGERNNVNFLVGDQIELDMHDGELHVAHVTGLRQGVYLEADPVSAPAVSPPQGDDLDADPAGVPADEGGSIGAIS